MAALAAIFLFSIILFVLPNMRAHNYCAHPVIEVFQIFDFQ